MSLNFQNKIKFNQVKESIEQEFSFDGGLVTDIHETKLATNQSPNLANIYPNNDKSIKTRNGYLRYNTTPIGASSATSNTGTSTGTSSLSAYTDRIAQTFQVDSDASMVQVDLYLAMNTSGQTQYVQAQLWSTSTTPSALVDYGQILLVSGTSETAYSFRFRVPQSLTASTSYAIVLTPYLTTSSVAVNQVNVHRTGNAYANGAAYTSSDSGMNWSAVSSADFKFNIYTGATASTGLLRFYTSTGIQQLIGKFGTSLYRGTDNTGATTAITLGSGVSLTSANYIDYTIANDTLLLVDGTNMIQKYRGSTNSNYTTGTISVTNGSATVTGSGTSWSTTTNATTGEYIKLPDGKWYKITAIASDTSLTVEVSYQGSTQSGQTYTISPWGEVQGKLNSSTTPSSLVRPTPAYIENHVNRIWTLSGNVLNFSVLDTSVTEEHFNDWDTANNAGQINIPFGKGDTGTGLYSLGNALYIWSNHSIWAVYGTSPANFELRNINREIGMISKKTLVEWNNVVIFLSDQGLIMFDGSNTRNISDGVVNELIVTWASKKTPVATLDDNKYVIAYTSSGNSYNDSALVYDLQRGIYTKHTSIYVGAFSRWTGGTDDGRTMFASSNQGSIYRYNFGSNDDGYEIYTLYDTPSLGWSAGVNDKIIKKFYLQQKQLGDWEMSTKQIADLGKETIAGSDINLSSGSLSTWGSMTWGTDSWSSADGVVTTRLTEFQGNAKYFKYRFEQTGYNQGVEIIAMLGASRVRRLR